MQENIVKSPNDSNTYRAFTLDNGLRVLLVSQEVKHSEQDLDSKSSCDGDLANESDGEVDIDGTSTENADNMEVEEDETDKSNMAAAALCINVGSFSDPDDLPGLAHFLEHMIFMGSEKYPQENAYESFISSHGGTGNAWTDCEQTLFVMDIVPKHFKEALDIFANCFISPLLRPDSMDREIEAVDSEFSLQMPVDSERRCLLLQSTAKEKHPMSKFTCGNIKSLKVLPAANGIDVNKALHEFYYKHYSAEHMTLVIHSIETLDTLEEWVREIFPSIPNLNVPAPSFDNLQQPFDMKKFNRLYKVVPVKDIHEMKLTWVLPPALKHYRSKPISYIEWLVGHEGKGSILTYLRKKFFAVTLAAGSYDTGFDMNSTCSLFSVTISLTELGMDHVLDVLVTVFQYLKMLAMEGPKEYIFEEMKTIAATEFRFEELEEPYNYVEKLATDMQLYPCEEYLTGSKLFIEYNEELIQEFLNVFSHTNVNIAILSSRHTEDTCKETEKWSQCKFSCEDIPSEWISQLSSVETVPYLHLPEPNKFIATEFDVKEMPDHNDYPYVILENEHGRLWYKENFDFKVPKACVYFHLITPVVISSALNYAMADLFIQIVSQTLCEEIYPAEIAYAYSCMSATDEGLSLQCWGFNHKLMLLLEIVLDKLSRFQVEEKLMDVMKDQLKNKYYNALLQPSKLIKYLNFKLTVNVHWSPLEKRNELQNITPEMLMAFVKEMFTDIYVEGLIQGNYTKEEALALHSLVVEKLNLSPLKPEKIPKMLSYKMPYGETFCQVASFNKLNSNSVVTNFFQFGPRSLELQSNIELLVEFMYEPCFDKLRTKEQLGYAIYCNKKSCWNSLGFFVSVHTQSAKYSCMHVHQRIEEFLESFLLEFEAMSEEKFQTQLNSLIEHKKQPSLNLKEDCDFNWYLMLLHLYNYNVKQQQISYLEKLKLDDFKLWLKHVLPVDVEKRRVVFLQVLGPEDEALKDKPSADAEAKLSNSCNPMSFQFLPSCKTTSSVKYINDLDDFTSNLELFPKYKSCHEQQHV